MDQLCLNTKTDDDVCHMTVESFITFFIYSYLDRPQHVKLYFMAEHAISTPIAVSTNVTHQNTSTVLDPTFASCTLPIYVSTDGSNTVSAGLCNVARKLIRTSMVGDAKFESLLGFKGASLKSPSETALWTKFCEIDMIDLTTQLLLNHRSHEIPDELYKYESHFQQGLRLHNIYKIAQTMAKLNLKGKPLPTPTNTPDLGALNVEHRFAEGLDLSLADLILFVVYYLLFEVIVDRALLEKEIPFTIKWYNLLLAHEDGKLKTLMDSLCCVRTAREKIQLLPNCRKEQFSSFTLNKCDPKSYKPRNRIFTRQLDIDIALNKLLPTNRSFEITSDGVDTSCKPFDWTLVPEALMLGSKLPAKRLERKKQQLESMAKAVLAMARVGDVIVDFCSGTGQLAILIANCLPQCHIIVLENKEESIDLARERVKSLGLANVSFYQCNLDYFKANFDIGVSLHACGVATDIVLDKCFAKMARFVCCACCYGKVHETHNLSYPRSTAFRQHMGLTNKDYMFVAHCADQFHEDLVPGHQPNPEKAKQGLYCMDVVDTDRKLCAEEIGYTVLLTRLKPENCTPKNRLLIGNLK